MSRKAPITKEQLFWEIHKRTQEAERQAKKYDKAIENLILYTNEAKRKYPEDWDRLMAEKQRVEDLQKQINQEYEAKQEQKAKDELGS